MLMLVFTFSCSYYSCDSLLHLQICSFAFTIKLATILFKTLALHMFLKLLNLNLLGLLLDIHS